MHTCISDTKYEYVVQTCGKVIIGMTLWAIKKFQPNTELIVP